MRWHRRCRDSSPKSTPAEELADVIRAVAAGKRYVDPEIAATALSAERCPLTDRELDVMRHSRSTLSVQQIAETVGCEDYPNLNFKPTVKADARVQKLQAAINVIDIYVKDTAGKLMGVSALAAIAVENQGVALTGANLWPTFHALGDMARETESLVESVTA